MTVGLLRHERDLRWELVEAIPPSAATTTVEMPAGSDVRSFLHRIDVRALVRMRSGPEIPIRHRVAAAQLRASGCRVILATDRNIEFLNSLAELCPEVHQVIVGHGVLVPMLRTRLGVTHSYPNRQFCVWSEREVELVKEYAPEPVSPVSLGSLRNALYVSSLRDDGKADTDRTNQICLVSSFVGLSKENQRRSRADERWLLREFLINAVRRLAQAWSLPVIVALKPQTMYAYTEGTDQKWDDERSYYTELLQGCGISFTKPDNPFETYQVVDNSAITLGLFVGPIVEGFGRGNVAMSTGVPRLDARFGSLPSAFHLTEASLARLEGQSLSQLLELREWLGGNSGRLMREYFLESATSYDPILQVRSIIARQLG